MLGAIYFQVTFLSRRPPNVSNGKRMRRLIRNEVEVASMLRMLPGVAVHHVDLAPLTLPEQLQLIMKSEVLIGVDPLAHKCDLLSGCLSTPQGSCLTPKLVQCAFPSANMRCRRRTW